jgi:hypothetical protein
VITETGTLLREIEAELAILACAIAVVALSFLFASETIVLAGIVVGGSLLSLAAVVLLHVLPTGYHPIRDAVSDYGVGPYRIWYRVEAEALAAAGFATAIASAGTTRPESAPVIAFLGVFSVARLLIPLFPTDLEGQPRTTSGWVHSVLAIAAFGSLATAAGLYRGTSVDEVVGWTVVITVVSMIVVLHIPTLRRVFGLAERLFYLSMIGWFLVIGVDLVQLAR